MRIRFKCKCGKKLECSIHLVRQQAECPVCRLRFKVPSPPREVVQRLMKQLPYALPGCSFSVYEALITQIGNSTRSNVNLCKQLSIQDLAYDCVDDAIQILRNVESFLQHSNDGLNAGDGALPEIAVAPLCSMAAGASFGGIGDRRSKIRTYKKWLIKADATSFSPRPHPLQDYAHAMIESLKSELSFTPAAVPTQK